MEDKPTKSFRSWSLFVDECLHFDVMEERN